MYGGQDYGASQFGGAGFIASPANEAAAGTQGNRGGGNNKVQTLRAITVKQLALASQNPTHDDHICIDGEDIVNLTIVGKIIDAQQTSTAIELTVNDGTGRVLVKYWSDGDESEAQAKAEWVPGVYVRVHGHVRNFDNQRSIVGFNIRVIQDFDEVTYHFLQCIFQHADLVRKLGGGGIGAPGAMGPASVPAYGGAAAPAVGGGGGAGGMPPMQADVVRVLESAAAMGNIDVSFDQVVQQLGNKYNPQQIKQAIEGLMDEAYIYTTTSDNHFRLSGA